MKSILQFILAFLARRTVRKYKPLIIGVTGSVGKTSTREAVFTVLKTKHTVWTSEKNYNTEIGLPLTILGIPYSGKNIFRWLKHLHRAGHQLLFRYPYPQILLLEYGIDHPGDMDHLLSIARPTIGVVTAIGEVPVHVEFFDDPEAVVREKTKLIQTLPANGFAILNHDDYAVYDMKEKTEAHVLTFGFEENADLAIQNYELHSDKDVELGNVPSGITFKIEHKGHVVPFLLKNTFGKPQAYAAAAAAAVGMALEMNLIEASDAIRSYVPPPGRLCLLKGNKHSFILDDTYNAAPEAMRAALETLAALPGKRKIAVLGDMLEIGKYAEQVHRAIGDQAADFVDLLFTVGPRAKFIADEAKSRGMEGRGRFLPGDKVRSFDDALSAGRALDPMLEPGDLVLVKGSQSIRMEKAVEEIMAHPEQAAKLLVRQDEYWKNH